MNFVLENKRKKKKGKSSKWGYTSYEFWQPKMVIHVTLTSTQEQQVTNHRMV